MTFTLIRVRSYLKCVFDNELYAKDIGKKVRAGIRQKQKTGLIVNLPMGYYKDKNTGEVYIDETAAEIVREVFQRYIGGHGITAIAGDFNNRGIKSLEYFSHRKISSTRTELCKKFLSRTEIPNEERYCHKDFLPSIIDTTFGQGSDG